MSGTVTSGRKTFKDSTGADTFNIGGDAVSVTIAGKMKAGDIINVEGLASEYTASASGRTITLKSDTQTIKFQLDGTAGSASVRFLDGDLTATYAGAKAGATLGGAKLGRKAIDIDDSKLGSNDSSSVEFGGSSSGGGSTGASVGNTFTLSSSADTGSAFAGTSNDDTYVAQIAGDLGTGTTLNAGDSLDGRAGTDTLIVSVAGASTAAVTSAAVTLTGVEKVLVSNFDSNTNDAHDNDFDASLWTGVSTVGLSASNTTGDTSFSNLGNIVTAEMSTGSADLTVGYLSTVVEGTADVQALKVSGLSAGTFTADAGIETVAITSNTVASTLAGVTATGATKLTIAGDKLLTVTGAIGTTMKTIDASASTGGVSLVLGTADLTVTGGSGNDTIRLDGGNVDANDSINAGSGTDSLQLTAAVTTAANGARLAGFENLFSYFDLTGNAGGANAEALTITQDVSLISGITNVGVTKMTYTDDNDTAADTGAVTAAFTGMSGTQTMSISGITSAGDANDNGAMTAAVTFALATDTANDSGTITLGTASAAAAVAGANNAITLDVTASDYETLTIKNQGGSQTVGTLTAADATTLNIDASKAFTITTLTASAVKNINASTSSANVTVGSVTAAATITGGSGNDNFTGGANADVISGGAGNDTLSGGAGNDSVDGGAGNDSITAGTGNDTINGGDGDDIFADAVANIDANATEVDSISGGAGNDTFVIADFSDLTSAATIDGGDGTDSIQISEDADIDFTANTTILANVRSIEKITFSALGGGGNRTITVNDGIITGGAITLELVTGVTAANTVNAAGVLASTSQVNFTDLAGLATTYSIGNGKDNAAMGDGGDTVTVTNNAYLSSSDTLAGGTGSDTLSFTYNTASTNTITASQLANVKGFETFSINNATDATLVNYVLTLDDTVVGNQVSAGTTFTITRDSGDDGTTKITGSSVSSSYALALTGGDGADTLIGGAGADTISGGNGADSLTGGAGNDTFSWAITNTGLDRITDFDFGTSTTTVDVLKFTGGTWQSGTNVATASGTGTFANARVIVLDTAAYADISAMNTAVTTGGAFAQTGTADSVILWQDTLGQVHVTFDTDGATTGGQTDLAILVGVTIADVAAKVTYADFSLA